MVYKYKLFLKTELACTCYIVSSVHMWRLFLIISPPCSDKETVRSAARRHEDTLTRGTHNVYVYACVHRACARSRNGSSLLRSMT